MSNEKRIEESKGAKDSNVILALTQESFKEENLCLMLRGEDTDKGFCRKIADGLYLQLKCIVKNDEDYVASAFISENNLKHCFPDISIQEAFEIAKANTLSQGISFKTLSESLAEKMDMANAVPDMGMYILTYEKSSLNGAAIIAFSETIKTVQAELGSERFYMIPSSIHEWIIVSEDFINDSPADICGLRDIIMSINGDNTLISESEVLSDNLYYYDGEKIVVVA